MKKLLLIFLLILLLAACVPAQPSIIPFIATATLTATETISPEPSHTPTIAATKTETPISPSSTPTPAPTISIPDSIYDILPPGQYLLYSDWSKDVEIESTYAISPITKEVYLIASMRYATSSTNGRFLIVSDDKTGSFLFDCWNNQLKFIENSFSFIGLSPDGELSISGGNKLKANYLKDRPSIDLPIGMKLNDTIHYAVWSPDGKWIGYVLDNPNHHMWGVIDEYNSQSGVYITHSDCIDSPQNCASLTYGPFFPADSIAYNSSLTWSPDSRYLAYAQEGEEIHIHDLTTGEENVIKTPYWFSIIFWSSDGKWIAFNNYDGIFLISPATKKTIQLTDYPGWLSGWLVVPEPTPAP